VSWRSIDTAAPTDVVTLKAELDRLAGVPETTHGD
jgi:hypothetical protein